MTFRWFRWVLSSYEQFLVRETVGYVVWCKKRRDFLGNMRKMFWRLQFFLFFVELCSEPVVLCGVLLCRILAALLFSVRIWGEPVNSISRNIRDPEAGTFVLGMFVDIEKRLNFSNHLNAYFLRESITFALSKVFHVFLFIKIPWGN